MTWNDILSQKDDIRDNFAKIYSIFDCIQQAALCPDNTDSLELAVAGFYDILTKFEEDLDKFTEDLDEMVMLELRKEK